MPLPIAKVFTTGNSQAVRLPKAFRVSTREMWITKNEVTGEIVLRPKDDDQRRRNLETLFKMIEEDPFADEFIPARPVTESRNPLAEWAAQLPSDGRHKKMPGRSQVFLHPLGGPGEARAGGPQKKARKSGKP